MFFIFPIGVDVPMRRLPWMNWVLMALTVAMFPLTMDADGLTPLGEKLVAGGESWLGHVGHVLVHGDVFHLLGNMVFLWVFGNAVCAKVGNIAYAFLYFGLGAAGSLLTHVIDPTPGIGASGAINSIVGIFVAWYTLNTVRFFYCYWFLVRGDAGDFELDSYWAVLLWLAFDVWGVVTRATGVGYWAHIVGLVLGFVTALLLLKTGLVKMEEHERSILDLLSERRTARTTKPAPRPLSRPLDAPGAPRINAATASDRGRTSAKAGSRPQASMPSRPRRPTDDDAPIPLADMPEDHREGT